GPHVLDLQGVLAGGQAADAEPAIVTAGGLPPAFQYPDGGAAEAGLAGEVGDATDHGRGVGGGDNGEQGQGGGDSAGECAPAQGRTGRHGDSSGLLRVCGDLRSADPSTLVPDHDPAMTT